MITNTLTQFCNAGVRSLWGLKQQGCNGSALQSSSTMQVLSKAAQCSNFSTHRNILDKKRRLLSEKCELRRKVHKAFCRDPDLPNDMRERHRFKLAKLPRNGSFTRIRNRCIFTGRSRGVYELFRMSRIVFRDLANKGELNGIKKASW